MSFEVTPSTGKMVLVMAFFGVCSFILYNELIDPRGVVISHLIKLGPFGADLFFGTLLLASIGFVVLGFYGFIQSWGSKVFLVLDHNSITGPSWYGRTKTIRISFGSIRDVNLSQIKNDQFLVLHADDGRKIKVGSSNFRIASEWSQFLDEFRLRTQLSALAN